MVSWLPASEDSSPQPLNPHKTNLLVKSGAIVEAVLVVFTEDSYLFMFGVKEYACVFVEVCFWDARALKFSPNLSHIGRLLCTFILYWRSLFGILSGLEITESN